jgi:hypothetical protein
MSLEQFVLLGAILKQEHKAFAFIDSLANLGERGDGATTIQTF